MATPEYDTRCIHITAIQTGEAKVRIFVQPSVTPMSGKTRQLKGIGVVIQGGPQWSMDELIALCMRMGQYALIKRRAHPSIPKGLAWHEYGDTPPEASAPPEGGHGGDDQGVDDMGTPPLPAPAEGSTLGFTPATVSTRSSARAKRVPSAVDSSAGHVAFGKTLRTPKETR